VYYGTYIAVAILVLKIILLIVTLLALYGVAKGILTKNIKNKKTTFVMVEYTKLGMLLTLSYTSEASPGSVHFVPNFKSAKRP
jgi:hypothetical protein